MKTWIPIIALLIASIESWAQNNIGIGTTSPDASSILDLSSTTKGFLFPRMTYTQRTMIGSPVAGLLVYQTNSGGFPIQPSGIYFYDGSLWKRMARADEIGGGGSSGWTVVGDNQYSNLTGNVGMGTSSPSSKFHLVGNMLQESGTITLNHAGSIIQMQNAGENKVYMQLSGNNLRMGTNSGNTTGNVTFRMNGDDKIWIDQNGDMGIGAQYPLAKLQIVDGQDASYDPSTGNGYIMLGPVGSTNLMLDNNEILARNDLGQSTLYVQQDGGLLKIGDGTAATTTKVQITGGEGSSLSSHGYVVLGEPDGTNITMDVNEIQARSNGSGSTLYLQRSGGTLDVGGHTTISKTGSGEVLKLDGTDPNIGFWRNGVFRSWIGQYANEMYIASNDKLHIDADQIAIGTVQSTANNYKLTVTGKIICEELKVELTASWPDYVFGEDYQLKPLHELKSYIATNKHLPNIPKASDVEKDGLEVGEMNRKLLEKVEELTLYIIDLQEQVDQLKSVSREQ